MDPDNDLAARLRSLGYPEPPGSEVLIRRLLDDVLKTTTSYEKLQARGRALIQGGPSQRRRGAPADRPRRGRGVGARAGSAEPSRATALRRGRKDQQRARPVGSGSATQSTQVQEETLARELGDLQAAVVPLRKDNARLVRESNALHQEMLRRSAASVEGDAAAREQHVATRRGDQTPSRRVRMDRLDESP